MPSFKPVAREIEVRTGERLRVDIRLELGGLTDEIKVVAETPLLNTTTREPRDDHRLRQGHQHAAQRAEPVHVRVRGARRPRRFGASEHQLPAVRQRRHGRVQRQRRRRRQRTGSCSTARRTRTAKAARGNLGFVPSPDAVQEVRVDTNTYDAQFGRTGGGTVSVSVKSGTNRLAGTASYMHRDKSLNQNLYQNIRQRHSEDGSLPRQSGVHDRRAGRAAEVRRPQQDVLLLQLRVPEVGDSRQRERAARADRSRAGRATSRSR